MNGRTQLTSEQLADIVMELNGEVEPYGSSEIDDERYRSLCRLTKVVELLTDEISDCANFRDRGAYSIKNIADKAYEWLKETRDWINMRVESEEEE